MNLTNTALKPKLISFNRTQLEDIVTSHLQALSAVSGDIASIKIMGLPEQDQIMINIKYDNKEEKGSETKLN